ncbi:MAG: helix-turn-helix domain-containing protein [Subdoligranulum sp.]
MDTQALVAMRIQQLCAEHGYNLNQLARSCGVPPSTVKNIIHGASHNPGIVTIKRCVMVWAFRSMISSTPTISGNTSRN